MVYVYTKLSKLNKYIGKELTCDEIEKTLKDLGMDIKGVSDEKDPELKIEITAEKMDMISPIGIARAIKYYRGLAKEIPEYKIKESGLKVIVEDSVDVVRPKTVCAIVRDVPASEEFIEEIIELQEKLHSSFGRNRKKAAIGIYPLSKIKFPVYYKADTPSNIRFIPLEFDKELSGDEILKEHETGKKYSHLLEDHSKYPFFIDSDNEILSMPPIINSEKTGRVTVSDKELFIECSGHNITHLDNILKIIVTTLIEMGCSAESVDVIYPDNEIYKLSLDSYVDLVNLEYINKITGLNLSIEEIKNLAPKVMLNVLNIDNENNISFKVPCYRCDIWHDCDIADDIARAYGYNNIIPRFPEVSSVGEMLPFSQFREDLSELLRGMGFLELYTYMLTSTERQFDKLNLNKSDLNFVKLYDSAEQGLNMVRINILPEILTALRINRKNQYPQYVFENGIVIVPDENTDVKAKNIYKLSIAIADPKTNYTDIKKILDSIVKLKEYKLSIERADYPFLIKGRSGEIIINDCPVGFIGEIHPKILRNFDLLVPVSVLEIDLNKLFELEE